MCKILQTKQKYINILEHLIIMLIAISGTTEHWWTLHLQQYWHQLLWTNDCKMSLWNTPQALLSRNHLLSGKSHPFGTSPFHECCRYISSIWVFHESLWLTFSCNQWQWEKFHHNCISFGSTAWHPMVFQHTYHSLAWRTLWTACQDCQGSTMMMPSVSKC